MSLVWTFSFFMVQYNDVVVRKEAQPLLLVNLVSSELFHLGLPNAERCYKLDLHNELENSYSP